MEKPALYIETTIASYATSRQSKDIVIRAHQEITLTWWRSYRHRFDLYTSEVVIDEAASGDPGAAKKRLDILRGIPRLRLEREIELLARRYIEKLNFPRHAELDAIHLAFAVYYELDYLLTWNCTHLANEFLQRRLVILNNQFSIKTPYLVTPEDLIYSESEG